MSASPTLKHQTIHIFQVKHIRGILFDDAEKSNRRNQSTSQQMSKNQMIGLEIKTMTFLKPATPLSSTAKKAKTSQDDSVLNYATSTKATTNNE